MIREIPKDREERVVQCQYCGSWWSAIVKIKDEDPKYCIICRSKHDLRRLGT